MIQNSIVQSFEQLEITEQQRTTWTSNNCFHFLFINLFPTSSCTKRNLWRGDSTRLTFSGLNYRYFPAPWSPPCTFRIIKIHEKHPQKNYAVWSGFLRLLVGVLRRFIFVSLGFKIHAEKMHPKDASFKWSCVIQPNSLFDVHFTCYFGNNHPNHWTIKSITV